MNNSCDSGKITFKNSPAGLIPSDWDVCRVHEICELGRGRVISQEEIDHNPGSYPVYSSQSKDEGVFGYLNSYDFEGEYVTWTTDGAYAGSVFYRSEKFNCTNVCGTLRAKNKKLSMRYLALTLSIRTRRYVSYVGNPKLMNNVMGEIFIPLPSRQEQHDIAEILNKFDRAIALTETHIAKLKKAKAGLLHDLLTRGIDENGELRDPIQHPEQFKDSPIGKIPVTWKLSSVEFEFDIMTGFTLGQHRQPKNHPRKYLRVANVQRENILLDDVLKLEANDDEFNARRLEKDDLLVVEGHANPLEIGRCAIVTEEAVGLTHQNHLFRLRSRSINSQFALLWLNSEWTRSYWRCLCGTSSGLNTINQKILNALCIVLPDELEQKAIVNYVETQKIKLIVKQAYLEKLQLLKKGLMSDLLTGRVRVKIESSEEI